MGSTKTFLIHSDEYPPSCPVVVLDLSNEVIGIGGSVVQALTEEEAAMAEIIVAEASAEYNRYSPINGWESSYMELMLDDKTRDTVSISLEVSIAADRLIFTAYRSHGFSDDPLTSKRTKEHIGVQKPRLLTPEERQTLYYCFCHDKIEYIFSTKSAKILCDAGAMEEEIPDVVDSALSMKFPKI